MTDPIETAVDATLDVAAEHARVTAERDELKARVLRLEGNLAEQARALETLTQVCEDAKADREELAVDAVLCILAPTDNIDATRTDRMMSLVPRAQLLKVAEAAFRSGSQAGQRGWPTEVALAETDLATLIARATK